MRLRFLVKDFARYTNAVVESVCKVMLTVLVLTVCWVVFGRYVLQSTPRWGEELALLTMVWFGLLSASLAVHRDAHLRITVVDFILPKRCLKALEWFVLSVVAAFAVVCILSGSLLVELTSTNTMPGMGISSAWLYLAVPVSGAVVLIQTVDRARTLL